MFGESSSKMHTGSVAAWPQGLTLTPESASSLVRVSVDDWWKGLLLVLSNLLSIPGIFYTYRIGALFVSTQFAVTIVASVMFHTCLATGFCFSTTLDALRLVDYIFATHSVSMLFSWFAGFEKPYDVIADQVMLALTIAIVVTNPFSLRAIVLTTVAGFFLLFYKYVFVDRGAPPIMRRLYWPSLALGFAMLTMASTAFLLDGSGVYWGKHTIWHSSSMLGAYFIMLGSSRDAKRWYGARKLRRRLSYLFCICAGRVKVIASKEMEPSATGLL